MRLTSFPVARVLNKAFVPALLLTVSIGISQTQTFAQALGQRELPSNLNITENKGNSETKALMPPKAAIGDDLYCAGFINSVPTPNYLQIVGAEHENIRAHFAQGDIVYLNAGRAQSVEEGLLYSIVRPHGDFRSPFAHTSGQRNLGVFTSELGVLRVISVQENTSVAKIIFSCADIQFGDQLRGFEERRAPTTDWLKPLPRYQPTSGNKPGRIVLQRSQKEVLAARDVVYIDLGKENGVSVGDKFTIFRYFPDDSNPVRYNDDDIQQRRSGGFESDTYRGGTYSNDHPREGRQKVKNARKQIPRTIIGELVVISIQPKSATAVITRTTQEVHTGDHIEAQ
ncbi:MAG TPA: hypothetical protein VFD58_35655 [Blastocatellia bacterium]|nr:hypothetical protein [Blastocatellia bacterium]